MSQTDTIADDDQTRTIQSNEMTEQIARCAYHLWEQEGCPEGCDLDHWSRAEQIVASDASRHVGPDRA